jgi:hypothetical protein
VQVAAFSTPAGPGWRWRIVNYAGEMVEESRETFPTITVAVSHGTKRLLQMNVVDNSVARPAYRTTVAPATPLTRGWPGCRLSLGARAPLGRDARR